VARTADRKVPRVPRIKPQPWMTAAPTRRVLKALAAGGVAARFVGGAVRDALLGRPVADVDIATLALLQKARIKAVPTGIDHGTVTAVVSPRHYEITTLRRDVESFGRHARVAFTDDWQADAERRDFTMNALSLDADGTLHDYVGGLDDVKARHVRFVGDPETRIREDVLRLLRFYRFHAQIESGAADEAARAACRALAPLLPTLSAERVAAELMKLLAAPDPLPTLVLMAVDEVLPVLLPEATRPDRLEALIALEPDPDPLRRLAALSEIDGAGARALAERLRLSGHDRDRLVMLAAPPWPVDLAGDAATQRQAIHHLGAERYADLVLLKGAEAGPAARKRVRALLAVAGKTKLPAFPLRGRDATALGIKPGPRVGELLAEVEAWWESGDFRATRKACLAELKRRVRGS
jgi:poly(A) polymerase